MFECTRGEFERPTIPEVESEASFELHHQQTLPFSKHVRKFPTQEAILAPFSERERAVILENKEILTALACFIGKDFAIPVELNAPGNGWHWNFAENTIRVDPLDLLVMPMDYLRFVIGHEGAHRRISRLAVVPTDLWNELGYSFMTNCIEDPRVNNFLSHAYAPFYERMRFVYELTIDFEKDASKAAIDKLGYEPRFVAAGFEYIKQWYCDLERRERPHAAHPSADVEDVITKTTPDARASWHTYPTEGECSLGESFISAYADHSFEINYRNIWPEFKKLVDADLKDQNLEEVLKSLREKIEKSDGNAYDALPPELWNNLTPEELESLMKALAEASGTGSGAAIPLSMLPEGLKEKLEEYFRSLPESERRKIEEKAAKTLADFEKEISDDLHKMAERGKPAPAAQGVGAGSPLSGASSGAGQGQATEPAPPSGSGLQNAKDLLNELTEEAPQRLEKGARRYSHVKESVLPLIRSLEQKIRQIFKDRKKNADAPPHTSGTSIDIGARIREIAQEIPAIVSKAWRRKSAPLERDYAISILVDLSGSMNGEKIKETFKAVVAVVEPFSKLDIRLQVLGFNSALYEYKGFKERLTPETRALIGSMVDETKGNNANYTDDGWALKETSDVLSKQPAKRKFIIVCTDGESSTSPAHSHSAWGLQAVLENIRKKTDQIVIALGVGPGTSFVERSYPNGLGEIEIETLPQLLSGILEDIITHEAPYRK